VNQEQKSCNIAYAHQYRFF